MNLATQIYIIENHSVTLKSRKLTEESEVVQGIVTAARVIILTYGSWTKVVTNIMYNYGNTNLHDNVWIIKR